jgi:hypothetical protein
MSHLPPLWYAGVAVSTAWLVVNVVWLWRVMRKV